MMNFLARPEGGDLMEVLVLLIIMALSALGSVLKSRKNSGKKAPPKSPKTKRPAETPSHPEREILERPDRPRNSQPFGLKRSPEIGSSSKAPPPLVVAARGDGKDSMSMAPEVTVERQAERSPMEPAESMAYFALEELSIDDIKKAIVLKELLGSPRALQAYGDPS